jgi:prevent-host-death family protein
MVMNMVSKPRRLGLAAAKAHLSEVIREVGAAPVVIHNRGRDVAVVVSVALFEELSSAAMNAPSPMAALLDDIAELKDKYGGGADIPYERVEYRPRDPFGRKR